MPQAGVTHSFDPAGKHDVHVFHEATEAQDAQDHEQWKKAAVAFRPACMAVLYGPAGEAGKPARRVLIGRGDNRRLQGVQP